MPRLAVAELEDKTSVPPLALIVAPAAKSRGPLRRRRPAPVFVRAFEEGIESVPARSSDAPAAMSHQAFASRINGALMRWAPDAPWIVPFALIVSELPEIV